MTGANITMRADKSDTSSLSGNESLNITIEVGTGTPALAATPFSLRRPRV